MVQRRGDQQAVNGRHGAAHLREQPAPGVDHIRANRRDARTQPVAQLVLQPQAQLFAALGCPRKMISFSTPLRMSPRVKALRNRTSSSALANPVGGAPISGRVGVNQVSTNRLFQEHAGAGTGGRHFLHELPTHRLSPTLASATETVWPHARQPGR